MYNLRELFDNCDTAEQAIELFDKKYDNTINLIYMFHHYETDFGEVANILLDLAQRYNIEYYEVLDCFEWDLTAVAIRVQTNTKPKE